MMQKLIFMNHILHLEENSLAKQIQSAQETYKVGGLTQEVWQFIADLELPNCFDQKIPKNQWKRLVKKVFAKANEEDICRAAESSKMMKKSMNDEEKFECKE